MVLYTSRFFFFFFFFFLDPPLRHMETPTLGVESELQLPTYTTATATLDPSHICDLYRSPQQCCLLNALSEARDQTLILTDTHQFIPVTVNISFKNWSVLSPVLCNIFQRKVQIPSRAQTCTPNCFIPTRLLPPWTSCAFSSQSLKGCFMGLKYLPRM